uniref:Uncharacterized protein n=1 Tax=Arundo donax TaxID=35708 RepID=A0A0A9EH91_ARUDO
MPNYLKSINEEAKPEFMGYYCFNWILFWWWLRLTSDEMWPQFCIRATVIHI